MPFSNRYKQGSVSFAIANALAEKDTVTMSASWHIFKNGRSGNFYLTFRDIATGKRKQVSLRTNDKQLAKRLAGERWQALQDAPPLNAPRTLSEFTAQYIAARGTQAANTLSTDRSVLRQFLTYIGDKEIVRISQHDCELFLSHKAGEHPSLVTVAKYFRTLKAAFGKAVQWGYMRKNPFSAFKAPRPPQQDAEYLTPEDFQSLLAVIPATSFESRRLRAVAIIAFDTGFRLSEILNLQTSAVDFTDGNLYVQNAAAEPSRHITAFTTKSKQQRNVPLSDYAAGAIRAHLLDNSEHGRGAQCESVYLFPQENGGILTRFYVSHLFKKYVRAAMPERLRVHFHSLRHSYGTRLWHAGVPAQTIQQLMGHSTIAVTERYTHGTLDTANVRAALNAAAPYQQAERGALVLLDEKVSPTPPRENTNSANAPDTTNNSTTIQRRKTGRRNCSEIFLR